MGATQNRYTGIVILLLFGHEHIWRDFHATVQPLRAKTFRLQFTECCDSPSSPSRSEHWSGREEAPSKKFH
jgi:hypothetical protein